MRQPDTEWRAQVEQVFRPLIDETLYTKWLPILKEKKALHLFSRHMDQKRYGTGNVIDIKLGKKQYTLTEFFVMANQEEVYLEVAYDRIKPWPRRRQYHYLFEQEKGDDQLLLFVMPTFRRDVLFHPVTKGDIESFRYVLLSFKDLQHYLKTIGVSTSELYAEDTKLYKRRHYEIEMNGHPLIIKKKWRSRPSYLKVPFDSLTKDAIDSGTVVLKER